MQVGSENTGLVLNIQRQGSGVVVLRHFDRRFSGELGEQVGMDVRLSYNFV